MQQNNCLRPFYPRVTPFFIFDGHINDGTIHKPVYLTRIKRRDKHHLQIYHPQKPRCCCRRVWGTSQTAVPCFVILEFTRSALSSSYLTIYTSPISSYVRKSDHLRSLISSSIYATVHSFFLFRWDIQTVLSIKVFVLGGSRKKDQWSTFMYAGCVTLAHC